MKFEDFDEIIKLLKEHNDKSHTINGLGLDTISFTEKLYYIIDKLLVETFGEQAKDTIDWYLYDNVEHIIYHTEKHKKGKASFCLAETKDLYDYIMEFEVKLKNKKRKIK